MSRATRLLVKHGTDRARLLARTAAVTSCPATHRVFVNTRKGLPTQTKYTVR